MKRDSIIKGAVILTIAGLITKVLGFIYRIYMSNLIGSEGMGIFQLIFPIYMICYTICCSGLFTAISKLIAEQKAKANTRNMTRIITCATTISFSLAIILSIIIYNNSFFISSQLLHETRTHMSIKLLAILIPFMALSSSIKGYFYGLKKTIIPASSQIIEQMLRIIVVFLLSSYFIPKGLDYACLMAVIGMSVGEIITFFYVLVSYKFDIIHSNKKHQPYKSYKKIIKGISIIAIPLTINRVLITTLSSVETILIPIKLQEFGMTHSQSISVYGLLTGMALPLILFPSVFTNSLSLMLLPTVSEAQASNNKKSINYTTSKTLQYSILIGIISTCLFIIFGEILGYKIYHDNTVGPLLTTLAWLCPFLYLNTTLGSILNGLNYQMVTLKNNIIGLIIRISFILLVIPKFGLKGYLWGLLFSYLIVSLLNLIKIIQITSIHFEVENWLIKPILISLILSFCIKTIYYKYIYPLSSSLFLLIGLCGVLILLYFIILTLLDCIPKNDWRNVKRSI